MKRLATVLALSVLSAGPLAAKGPPWITIELRPHMYNNQFLIARTWHHGTPSPMPLSGTAEGLVNGQRRSIALRFERTEEAHGMSIAKSWGDEGVWVLNIASNEAGHAGAAGAVVGIDRSGAAAFVQFPRLRVGSSRPATAAEIETLLRALDTGRAPPAMTSAGLVPVLRVAFPIILMVALAAGLLRMGGMIVQHFRTRVA